MKPARRLKDPLDTRELAWAAGLFEGEGYISSTIHGKGIVFPKVGLNMTDCDTVERFQRALGGIGNIHTILPAPPRKRQWRWQAQNFEACQATIALLWHQLGPRRRARAAEVLQQARETRKFVRLMRRDGPCLSDGDCEQPVFARGLCRSHYNRQWWRKRREKTS